MWEDEVARLLAAVAGSQQGVRGIEQPYRTPRERLEDELEELSEPDPEEEKRARRLQVVASDGDLVEAR
jgi:hypothetical protein